MERQADAHLVGEPVLLADAPPETRGDAAAEDDREEPGGRGETVLVGGGGRADEEVRLVQLGPRDVEGAALPAGRAARGPGRAERDRRVPALPPLRRQELQEAFRLEGADGDEEGPLRAEDLAEAVDEPRARLSAPTVSSVPRIGAPRGWSGQ